MNITVVGGGTAGWVTALYARHAFPHSSVTLIESSGIGILGAGEGTTPHFPSLLRHLDISMSDLIDNCGATIKHAVKFSGWSEKRDYFHSFFDPYKIGVTNYGNMLNDFDFPTVDYSYSHCVETDQDSADYFVMSKLCQENRVWLENDSAWAVHFDARRLADYLKSIGLSRGIHLVDDVVEGFDQDESGNVRQVLLKDSHPVVTDFVFDASGFHRVVIGKLFKSEWKSYREFLPAKRALPFFLPTTDEIGPYTGAVAMKYGWMWRIPVQERYGCGYVFDSDFISDEEAKLEVETRLGHEVDVPKLFNFDAGSYQRIWINNCLAVGLAAGFVEPLEATSLWQMVNTISGFFSQKENIVETDPRVKQAFNDQWVAQTDEIVDFLHLHYVTKKKGKFWGEFLNNNLVPDHNRELLDKIQYEVPKVTDFPDTKLFPYGSWMSILFGNDLISRSVCGKYSPMPLMLSYLNERRSQVADSMGMFVHHREYLNSLRQLEPHPG